MVRNAVGAIIFQGTKFLLVHKVKISSIKNANKNIKGEWDFPKGGVEETDKDLEVAILRELKEETGSTQYKLIKRLDEVLSFSFDEDIAKRTGFKKQITTMFIVEYVGDGSDLIPLDCEIKEVKFINFEDVLERLTHDITKDYFKGIPFKFNRD
ncbi:NUDIX domain-containing protein [Fictibacillus sp. BK138]|uniref:NUDIX domain-containing protein n=1 Tax=Fictibacillus sp. BK138 TaxID=2512121 RepID=UPI00102A72C3|nr:NUDIX hydrolase [Fictibacillus sp. BK138]